MSMEKSYAITLNGTVTPVPGDKLSYEQLVELAGYAPGTVATVVFCSKNFVEGASPKNGRLQISGNILPGETLTVYQNTIVNTAVTGNA